MDFNQKYEPKGNKVLHGGGQYFLEDFKDYSDSLEDCVPILYMGYAQLKCLDKVWFDNLKKDISNSNVFLQLGLAMVDDVNEGASSHYEKDVILGKYDNEIDIFCREVKKLGFTIFLRLGYEFNGSSWNGYIPNDYILAWRYFVDRMRKNNVCNVAMVWCFAPEGKENYMDYYPGNDYVDWWSVNIFSKKDMESLIVEKFLLDSVNNKKPVMVGEATPREVGVLDGEKSWNDWFCPFFNFINKNPAIKAFCYINWDWKERGWGNLKNWGDCRISQNEYIRKKYIEELRKSKYIHSQLLENFFNEVYN